jgi:hypothetical protein
MGSGFLYFGVAAPPRRHRLHDPSTVDGPAIWRPFGVRCLRLAAVIDRGVIMFFVLGFHETASQDRHREVVQYQHSAAERRIMDEWLKAQGIFHPYKRAAADLEAPAIALGEGLR